MNEESFRSLMREAVGDVPVRPWLNDAVRARIGKPLPRPSRAPWFALVAACLVLAVLVAAAAPRLLHRTSPAPVVPAATPTAVASPTPIDASNCTLPVLLQQIQTRDYLTAVPAGFLDTRTGLYTADATASQSVAGMPRESYNYVGAPGTSAAGSYSPAARRWLPVRPALVSPDGLSYAYVESARPGSMEGYLHRYDVESGRDVKLRSGIVSEVVRWIDAGILVDDSSGELLVDPNTGAATPAPKGAAGFQFVPFKFLPGDPIPGGFTNVGWTLDGHVIWRLYNPGQRSVDWVFYETAPGQRVYIYKGTQGDATGFEPDGALSDATGIWFSSFGQTHLIWHWDPARGLRKITIALPAGEVVLPVPAGPCF